ncbi:DNA (cytosine-5-)-methyltransferase [Streptococcus ruminantium]|uniref:DNA (cytosine-5-)-methyltransferase n=1 Tax=Streptococcus ruminantium TaxID=1917441 RepID=UPI0012DE1348|nr:DNA (cytosine-5-)-methyltransferase [Streptococcus ruminantium]BDD38492.1 DNA (cytosine-5-)-methyltransferase [Streptococcus ruminantium]
MKKLKIASLFSGGGGTDIGFAGDFDFLGRHYDSNNVEIVYANDIETSANIMFEKSFGIKPDSRNIREVKSSEIPSFDILTGGFPCQSFSVSAQNPKRLGIKDEKGTLFFEMVRILKDHQPKAFFAENVKGILSANKKEAFPLIIEEFEKAGYRVSYKLCVATKYGVPQKRERVFIVGIRKDLGFTFEFPDEPIQDTTEYTPIKAILQQDIDEKYYFSERAVQGMLNSRSGKKMNKGRAQDVEQPSNTVSSHLAKVSLNSTDPVLLENGRYRRYTPREVARIQSFPEDYELIGLESAQYKMLGNAIPPVMMWYIASKLLSDLRNHEKVSRKRQTDSR